MEKFLENYQGPSAKRKRTESETLEKKRAYDQKKRVRKFIPSWKNEYQWLEYNAEKENMFCRVCRQHERVGTFVTGSANFKLESIKAHAESESHVKWTKREMALAAKPGESLAEQAIFSLNAKVFGQLRVLFRNAHFLGKHGRPFTDFKAICALDEAKGVDIGKDYRNDKRAQEFMSCIAAVEQRHTKDLLDKAKFLSLIVDGATDTSHQEAEVCYVRSAINGDIVTRFVGIKNVDRANAESISEGILQLTEKTLGDITKKLVGFGTDGAPVMLGKNNGFVQKIRDKLGLPYIMAVHCTNHRLELAYRDACSKVPLYNKMSDLMLSLYYFYRNSPANRSGLRNSFLGRNETPLVPTRVAGTRWLPHMARGLKNLLDGYGAMVEHLEQVNKSISKFCFIEDFFWYR